MFFDRPGTSSESIPTPSPTAKRRRQLAALGLAATMALPAAALSLARVYADTAPPAKDAAPPSTTDTVKAAQALMDQGKYEEAEETLRQIDTFNLSDIDRRVVLTALTDASKAAEQRRAARTELAAGRQALSADRRVEAHEHFNAVAGNRFADSVTMAAAKAELARADGTGSAPAADVRTQLAADAPAGAPSPTDSVVPAIEPNPNPTTAPTTAPTLVDTPVPTVLPTNEPAPAPAAPAPAPTPAKPSGADLYHLAQQQYRKGDWIAARQNFVAAQEANYKPGLFEGETPARYLARMDAKESADKAATEARLAKIQEMQNAHARQLALVKETPPPAPAPVAEVPATAPSVAVAPPTTGPAVAVGTPAPEVPAPVPTPAPVEAPATAPAVAVVPPPVTPAPAPAPAPAIPAPVTPATVPAEAVAPVPTPVPAPVPVVTPAPEVAPTAVAISEDAQALQDLKATQRAADLSHQQNVYQAQKLVIQGSDARHQVPADLDTAQKLYEQAVQLDPDNAQARAGLHEVLILLGHNPSPSSTLDDTRVRNNVARQEIIYAVNKSLSDAHEATQKGEFGAAEVALERGQVASRQEPTIFTADELRNFDNQLAAARQANDAARARTEQEAHDRNDQQIKDRLAQQKKDADELQRKTIADLRSNAIDLTNHKRFREALAVVDQILILNPNDDYATGVRPLLEDQYNFQQQRIFTERKDVEMTHAFIRAEEEKIPYDDILRYPADWPGISQLRDQTVASEHGENKEDRAVQAQLDRALPELTFDGVGFSDVIDFLRDVSGANIFVNWKSLEGAGVDRNAPVTAKLRNVKFSKALNIILDSVGGGTAKLGYTIDEGVIEIATADELSKNTLTKVYDIRDLIINIPDFNDAPDFSLQSTSNNSQQNGQGGQGGGGGGGQGQGLFSGSGGQQNSSATQGPTREELVSNIEKIIQETVAPDSWKDSGGSTGALRELQGQLIVTQTPENQHALASLLEQLRETHSIQVTVETRFLTVERNFLEDIGVDLNFIFNANSVSSKVFSAVPVQAASSTFTQAPTTGVPGSIGSAAQGLTTAVTYLDDLQVTLLLRATQASVLNTEVTAPRVTLFNGQRAYVLVATQQAYVSNLTPAVGTGTSAFTPTISIVQTGVLLDVQATVSADRKYVTLTLRPEQSTLIALQSFTFQAGSSGNNNANNGGILGLGNIVTSQSGTIQEPEIQLTQVKTSVSVPDGGTLLLGGETIAGEVTKEQGTPILSKIPFLRRLFTNRSEAKDEFVLLILVKPTIIIEREIENTQFPMLTSKLGS